MGGQVIGSIPVSATRRVVKRAIPSKAIRDELYAAYRIVKRVPRCGWSGMRHPAMV